MPSTIVDSTIFGNIFSTDAMRAVWSDENRTQKYLDIEAALGSNLTSSSALSPRAVPGADGGIVLEPVDGTWDSSWQQGLIWGGLRRIGSLLETENDQITTSGLLWGGAGCRLSGLESALTTSGLMWGGGN